MIKNTILTILLFLSISSQVTYAIQFSFEKFPYNEKLPSNSVARIYNDKEGYMWFGTKDGLCRFDGYDIKVFRSSAQTPVRLSNNDIQCITEDNDQKIWVGTYEGINIIDKKNFTIKQLNNIYVLKDRINSILTDSKGYIWIGTSTNGVVRINPVTGKFIRFSKDINSRLKLKNNNVTNIYEDHTGRIWISLWKNGLSYIDQNLKQIHHISKIGANDNPFRIFQDKEGLLWICTWGDGIYTMQFHSNSEILIKPIILSGKTEKKAVEIVYSITQDDKYGYIWIVTYSGLSMIKKEADNTFKMLNTNSFFDETSNQLFHEIIKDNKGNLWIGSVGDGLFKLDFNKLSIKNYPLNDIKTLLNVQSYVTRFCQTNSEDLYIVINRIGLFHFDEKTGNVNRPSDYVSRSLNSISAILNVKSRDEIWVATEGEDLIHIFKKTTNGELKQIKVISLNNFKKSGEVTVSSLFEDSKGNVWIGSDNGIYIKPFNSSIIKLSKKVYSVNTIGEDTEKKIWIGTDNEGLFIFNPVNTKKGILYSVTRKYLHIKNYQSYSIQSICCLKNGDVYIGTKEGCIYYYNQKTQYIRDISVLYGITEEGILDILEDNSGFLWITTIKRIIRYNPTNHAVTNFSITDGLLVSSFFKDARIKLKTGEVLFGGNRGICLFNPPTLNTTVRIAKQLVSITDILVQNKSIFDDENNKHFNSKDKSVTLNYTETNLSIEFSALNSSSANKIQFAYRLVGIDNNWNYSGNNRRFVNYANLPTGHYKFRVKASDENGIWSNQYASLEIVILPPAYLSWWAYLIYFIIFFAGGFFILRAVANRIRLRNELKISHIEKEKSEELAQIKLRYFTNISHELLTPLTIIMLMIESLQKKNKGDSSQFDIMKDNIIRLKRLIQQILIFRKTESGNMKLKIRQNDVVAFVNSICQSNFKPLVNNKEINFKIDSELENYLAYFDPDKLDKIIYNLLSNAFKHTPKNGSIVVKLSFVSRLDVTFMRLSVSDSGDGIAEEDIPHIFKRFYISSTSDQSQSHGIGLALTNDLLQLHKGSIEVKSRLGEGAVFTIEIPVSMNAYTDTELSLEDLQPVNLPELPETATDITSETSVESEDNSGLSILIVEDNRELNDLIVENFSHGYNVLSAENGLQALKIIHEAEIDLVISDVMMPEMDGLTFCKILKNDVETSHINVLMLTAKNSTEDRIDCYNAGADSYIAKPFELVVLDARVRNLMRKRRQKADSFQKNQEINISSMEYGSIDELFLKQAVIKVEDNLSDDTFDFDQFAENMATSKSTLHRKLKSLTGLSPGEFIRSIRLKHAVQMLTNNMGNISEIAFAVGFNDPKYFSRCFKIEFGLTPREYQESKK